MKKLFVFLFVNFLLFACSTINDLPRQDLTTLLDFRDFSKKDFMITTETFQGNYESVGVVSYKIIPHSWHDLNSELGLNQWSVYSVNSQELLDSLYVMCKNLGANGIMNFWFKSGEIPIYHIRDSYTISAGGFAIIRK